MPLTETNIHLFAPACSQGYVHGSAVPAVAGHQHCEASARLQFEASQNPWLREIDLDFSIDARGSAAVFLCGKFQGTWRWDGAAYGWIPAGYRLPNVRIGSAADATSYLAHLLYQQPTRPEASLEPVLPEPASFMPLSDNDP